MTHLLAANVFIPKNFLHPSRPFNARPDGIMHVHTVMSHFSCWGLGRDEDDDDECCLYAV